jgi:hypothetical protein
MPDYANYTVHIDLYASWMAMTATKGIKFGNRFFWAYDVAAGKTVALITA